MKARVGGIIAGALFAVAAVAGPAAATPNQGDADKVLTVDNPNVSCADPTPLPKVEGGFGHVINVSADDPIDFVTVKSGQGAYLVSAEFDTTSGTITLSKDVSNYVIWTCEEVSYPS
jgi:hypothetical protein